MSSPKSTLSAEDSISGLSQSSSPERTIAFLVHSPESMLNNLPPDCDNKPLARQRRRRTSPEDQKILEAAFQLNSRPNKEEREEIISQVALGDKEIQIWFQNRRQSSRRRSKPLETDDIRAQASVKVEQSSPRLEPAVSERHEEVQSEPRSDLSGDENLASESDIEVQGKPGQSGNTMNETEESGTKSMDQWSAQGQRQDQVDPPSETTNVEHQESLETVPEGILSQSSLPPTSFTELHSSQGLPSSQDAAYTSFTKPTWLANRRSATYVRDRGQDTVEVVGSASPAASPAVSGTRTLRKSGSYLRLSMTEDGIARVIDRNAPSPPRSQATVPEPPSPNDSARLRRSYSATGLDDLFKQASPEASARTKIPRVSKVGRSRDSRAWEFWCDSEARNSLVHTAEQENSGSAADAIGLIRQNSRSALRPLSRKTNSSMVQVSVSSVEKQAKPKLQRARTTHGRLQQSQQSDKKGADEVDEGERGDSDKENWDPDDSATVQPFTRRPLQTKATNARRGRTVLGDNLDLPSYASSLGGLMDSERKRKAKPAAVDDEVASFMGTQNKDEDMDAVQSLLSMASGNWK